MSIFKYNASSGRFDPIRSVTNIQPSDFPYLIEDLNLGYYVARIDARLPEGLALTTAVLRYNLNFQGVYTWRSERRPLVETSHDFFSLRFSLQFWYRWKEGNNSGIFSKFEVDPSKISRVRAERSWKVERKSGCTLEICSMAQLRFRSAPGARTCMQMLHARSPFPMVALQSSASFSFLLFFSSFLWLHQVEIYDNH